MSKRLNLTDLKVIVFDFDGTLVDSQKMKVESFYKLFTSNGVQDKVVAQVLQEMPEESRYVILEHILRCLNYEDDRKLQNKVQQLAKAYDHIVTEGAKRCQELSGVSSLLRVIYREYRLFVSSVTPRDSLKEIISFRGWDNYFVNIYGYPSSKTNSLNRIIKDERVTQESLLVVGDGITDELSAKIVDCPFFKVTGNDSIYELSKTLGLPVGDDK